MTARALVALILLFALGRLPSAAQQLQNGQTPEQVRALLGSPGAAAAFGDSTLYIYPTVRVYFERGLLATVENRSDPPEGAAQQADDLYNLQKDYAAAAPLDQQMCDVGNSNACFILGYLYEKGLGVPASLGRAGELYVLACVGDAAGACTALGALYESARDYARAKLAFTSACNSGDPAGCARLGALYEVGHGVPVNLVHAFALYEKACAAGDPAGCAARQRLDPQPPLPKP